MPFVLETPAAAHAAGAPQALCINIRINAHFSFLLMVLLFKENKNLTFWSSNGTELECDHNVCPDCSDEKEICKHTSTVLLSRGHIQNSCRF